jgi:hypothetical protein
VSHRKGHGRKPHPRGPYSYPQNIPSVPSVLDDLSDVNASAPDDGDILVWDDTNGEWVPQAAGGGADVAEGFCSRIRWFSRAKGYSNARDDVGNSSPSVFGTGPTSTSPGSTLLNSFPHHTYQTSDFANLSCGLNWNNVSGGFTIGSVAGAGGFRVRMRFALNTAAGTTRRYFFGVSARFGTSMGSSNPSSFTNIIGYGKDSGSGDSNWRMMHNDGSGTATSTDTGVSAGTSTLYEVEIWCDPNASTVNIRLLSVLGTSRTVLHSASISTNLPANTQVLSPHMEFNTGTGTTGVNMNFYFCEVAQTGSDVLT